jgi:Putative Actinobacterial Holin-X, holin superfamily III
MHTLGGDGGRQPVGAAAKEVAERASTLARLELELAQTELKSKAGALGAGVGLGAAAAVLGLFAMGFLLATAAAGLATFLPTWLALLIVSLVLLAVAGILAAVATRKLRSGGAPVPEQALREAKLTTEAIKR